MATVKTQTKTPLYYYEEVGPNTFQQVACRDGRIRVDDHLKMIAKDERGGFLHLSDNQVIQDKQKRDIKLSNECKLEQNTWISANSSLRGDFKLPLNSILNRSQIRAENQHSVLVDRSYLDNTSLKIRPDTSVSILKSELINSKIETMPSDEEQVLYINGSDLKKTNLKPVDSSQMILDSSLNNVDIKGNSDIDASYIQMQEQTGKLTNTSVHGSDILLKDAVLIVSDSDIKEQQFTDEQALNGYLVIKGDCMRAEPTQKVTKTDESDLHL